MHAVLTHRLFVAEASLSLALDLAFGALDDDGGALAVVVDSTTGILLISGTSAMTVDEGFPLPGRRSQLLGNVKPGRVHLLTNGFGALDSSTTCRNRRTEHST